MTSKRSILILLSHFTPGTRMGGPLTSVTNLLSLLCDQYDFRIITFNHDLKSKQPYRNIDSGKWTMFHKYSVFYVSNYYQVISAIRSSSSDLVLLNSFFHPIFSIFIVILKKFGVIKKPIIIAPRGELFDESLKFKMFKKYFYISVFNIFQLGKDIFWQVSSEFEKDTILKKIKIKKKDIFILPNITKSIQNTDISAIDETTNADVLRMVYFSRISKDKNILFTLTVLNEVKRKILFDVYGPIEDEAIWNKFIKQSELLPNNITINYCGEYTEQSKIILLSKYDIFFLPTFSENFGNSIVESLISGTKVLISDRTPWRQLCSKGLGWDLPLENVSAYTNKIENYEIKRGKSSLLEKNLVRKAFMSHYYNENQRQDYISVYSLLIQSK
jgi:hypothetical protein